MFSLICAWINGWVNNGEAGDLRRHRIHYDVIVMVQEPGHQQLWYWHSSLGIFPFQHQSGEYIVLRHFGRNTNRCSEYVFVTVTDTYWPRYFILAIWLPTKHIASPQGLNWLSISSCDQAALWTTLSVLSVFNTFFHYVSVIVPSLNFQE